jgi:ABC-2 type transport system ATP-binding protein
MKRRLELARGLMTEPEILFLDEPTLGLDPQNRAGIWHYIRDLKARRGMTLLLTTHYMDEAEQLADHVGIIDNGRIITEGSPQHLVEQMGADVLRIHGQGDEQRKNTSACARVLMNTSVVRAPRIRSITARAA